jgi:NAD(P)H-dependent FMN reductase
MDVLVLVGSLRADSSNRRLADAAIAELPEGVHARVSSWPALLPHYDQDLDGDTALESVAAFRAEIAASDALILATPEFNGSLPSVLKNAIDWASRPRGASSIAGKPVAVLGASASPNAARWAREDALRVLRVAGAEPLEDTVGIASSLDAFAADGLRDADLARQVREVLAQLVDRPQAA